MVEFSKVHSCHHHLAATDLRPAQETTTGQQLEIADHVFSWVWVFDAHADFKKHWISAMLPLQLGMGRARAIHNLGTQMQPRTMDSGLTKGIVYRDTASAYPSVHYQDTLTVTQATASRLLKELLHQLGLVVLSRLWWTQRKRLLKQIIADPTLRPKPNGVRWIHESTAFDLRSPFFNQDGMWLSVARFYISGKLPGWPYIKKEMDK